MRQRGKASFMTEGLVASTYPAPGEGRRGVGVLQGEPLSPLRPEESPFVRCVGGGGGSPTCPHPRHVTRPRPSLARSLPPEAMSPFSLSLSLSQSSLGTRPKQRLAILWRLLVAYSGRTPSGSFGAPATHAECKHGRPRALGINLRG